MQEIFLLFISAHSLSRLAAISIIFTHEYSRDDASSKSKPIAKNTVQQIILKPDYSL